MSKIVDEYLNFKKHSPDSLLFYRLGGFYELYFEDAILAAKSLGIVLNHKKIADQKIPTCGFPANSLEAFSNKLLQLGFKITVAEQIADSNNPKKITRKINKIITPGTFIDEKFLSEEENILLAIVEKDQKLDLCFGNILLGDFYVDEIEISQINQYLETLKPIEILCEKQIILAIIDPKFHSQTTFYQPNSDFKLNDQTFKILSKYHNLALRNIFAYAAFTHDSEAISHFKIHQYQNSKYLKIDNKTINNLELKKIATIIDNTSCPIGKRFLQSAILKPLCDVGKINDRLDGVEFLIAQNNFLKELQNYLKNLPDLEKLIGKIAITKNANIGDLTLILEALQLVAKINEVLFWQNNTQKLPTIFGEIGKKLFADFGLINFLDGALQGSEIRAGFDPKLDHYKNLQQEIIQKINHLKIEYEKQSGVKNLKIEFHSLLGFYFEIKRDTASKINIPKDWQLLQNLNNSIRFSSEKLKNYQLENADLREKIQTLESKILQNCVQEILQFFQEIKSSSTAVGMLDLLVSFAILALKNNYVKPNISNQNSVKIIGGKHFISPQFIANDCSLDEEKIWLITGANMAGKSTFLRQNALIVLLAQTGCFVPAISADIGVRKNVFSKMIINDNLYKNQSSFMVEMLEMAEILKNADENSLVIIDELCQTTNAIEGEKIAFAIIKHLVETNKSLALITTHQPNLAIDCQNFKGIACQQISQNHLIKIGIANQSSAIDIVRAAQFPEKFWNYV